ncbi:MAG TPA: cupin domain-containing protein [Gemmatimonadaceae bacterium]|nr:cupin domain-containing protein [Gemmatimonadaceae bacterium]
MSEYPDRVLLSPSEGIGRLPTPEGKRFVEMYRHGTLVVEIYAPRGSDPQKPHTRDELYVVVAGEGLFYDGKERRQFRAGDLIFVPAHVEHRFERFTDDLVVWVMFYGPEGGEK